MARAPVDAEFGARGVSSSWLLEYEGTFKMEDKRRVVVKYVSFCKRFSIEICSGNAPFEDRSYNLPLLPYF